MDSLDEAMKKLQTDKKDGFTLTGHDRSGPSWHLVPLPCLL